MDSNKLEQERGIHLFEEHLSNTRNKIKHRRHSRTRGLRFGSRARAPLDRHPCFSVDAQEGPMPQTRFVLKGKHQRHTVGRAAGLELSGHHKGRFVIMYTKHEQAHGQWLMQSLAEEAVAGSSSIVSSAH